MARAHLRTGFYLVVGLVAGAATASAQTPAVAPPPGPLPVMEIGNPHEALNDAIEAQRRGDYEQAARLLQGVAVKQALLTTVEQQELSRLLKDNGAALDARRAAADQLRQAVAALDAGRQAEAVELLKKVAVNEQYLNAADRQTFRQRSAGFNLPGVAAAAPPADPATQARSLVHQARVQLALGDFDKAEQLTRDAAAFKVPVSKTEDSPAKLTEDLAKARTDPNALLKASRAALARREYDKAEQYARQSEKASSTWAITLVGDTPSKALKDIDAARKAAGANAVAHPAAPSAAPKADAVKPAVVQTVAKPDAGTGVVQASNPPAVPPPATPAATAAAAAPAKDAKDTEQARALLAQGRKAIDAGDLIKARQFAEQARALKPDLQWFEDNPDKLLADVARAEARTNPASAAVKPGNMTPAEAKAKAVDMLKQGRAQLADNKLDDAAQTLVKLRALPPVSWGLFEDSPEHLRQDVTAARQKQDKEESVKLLAQARQLMQEGKYEDAQRAAFRAQQLHGPYNNVFEFGDRPDKVLADLETARAQHKGAPTQQSAPAVAVNTKPEEKHPATQPPADGVRLASNSKPADAALPPVQPTPPPAAPALPPVQPAQPTSLIAGLPPVPGMPSGPVAAPLVGPAADPNRARADQLLVEAGRLERENKLLEARQKAVEAAQLHATFGPNEDSPDYALTLLAGLARRQINTLLFQATVKIQDPGDPLKNCASAEQDLLQARELAVGFGQDAQPIEAKMAWVRQIRAVVLHQPAPAPPPSKSDVPGAMQPAAPGAPVAATTPAPQPEGLAKLDKARHELACGATPIARKLAEEVYAGPYNLRDEASGLLRSIDAEDFAQQCRQDQKTFDAANSAYNRREYDTASRLLAAIDVRRLDEGRAKHWRELMQNPGMATGPVQLASADGSGTGSRDTTHVQPAAATGPDDAGHAHVSDDQGASLLKTTEAMRQVKFQQLRKDGLDVQSRAQEKVRMGQTAAGIDMLHDYLATLDKEQVDPKMVALLRAPVEKRLQQFEILKIQEDKEAAYETKNDAIKHSHEDKVTREQNKEQNITELMKRFNDNFRQGHYAEAQQAAMEAHELDPDNETLTAAMTLAKMQMNMSISKKNREAKADWNSAALADTDRFGPAVSTDKPIVIDRATEIQNAHRPIGTYPAPVKSEIEREIERKLTMPVPTLNFFNAPLSNVISDLRATTGINIYVDQAALDLKGVALDHPVSLILNNVSLKSALDLVLKQVHLTYIVKNECLQITTEDEAKGKLQRVTYQVADLVIPVPNSSGSAAPGSVVGPVNSPYAPTPITGPYAIGTGTPTGTPTGAPLPADTNNGAWSKSAPTVTREEQLINLITNAVEPHSWSSMGGPGTIDYHPLTMGLVVNQTPDIQEQIVDLLNSLRRLQDQEVALEVRFIVISDDFFERIGVDFSMNIVNNSAAATANQPALVSGAFKPAGFINDFTPSRFISGMSGPGTLTSDLGIPINSTGGPSTFLNTVPQYGGYMPGFSLGLAFLSQIQVFLFMEAVQGDNRVNVMQAPRITAFNGQTATLNVSDNQTFVTNVNVTIGANGNPLFQPIITNSGSTVSLTIQPVISADRRFVRLNFGNPFGGGGVGGVGGAGAGGVTLTNLVPGIVNTFPVVVPVFSGSAIQDPTEQVVFTQLIQQPVQEVINISTTVSVPDGGTVVMGGLKRLSESRSEYGPPILSKIPYINRLFKNVGYGRSAESLLIMVTPRIIIQEEEEERQTGFHMEQQAGQ